MSDPPTFGTLLRGLRRAANLTQGELAERSGLSVEGIGALERGDRRSPWPRTIDSLASALRLDARQKEALIAATRGRGIESVAAPDPPEGAAGAPVTSMPAAELPPRAPLPAGSRMPLAPNPLFVGRGEELLQVARALRAGDATVALGQIVASTGLGGLGKTQLAVEIVHRCGRFFAGGVFWLSFASADEIPLQVAACAGSGAVGLEADLSGRPLEERVKLVMGAWQSPVPRLLVFDNCEEESLLQRWRPSSGGCRVLVTSRRAHWSPTLGVTALPLDLLPRPDSIELLRRYRPDLGAGDPRLDAVGEKLGDLPLALHLAGRYLLAYRAEVGLDDYLAELDRPELIGHASLLGAGIDDSPSPTHHVQSLALTFALCLGRLDRDRDLDRLAIALLARMAWMAPGEAVPRDLLGRTLEDVDPRRRADGLRRLAAVGLVEDGDAWLRLHRLLAHFIRQEQLHPDARTAVARALIGCGEEAEQNHLTGSALETVIPHLVDMAGAVDDAADAAPAAELCTAAGRALKVAGDLKAARPWYQRALDIRERLLGPDHLETSDSLDNMGGLLWVQGDLASARALHERALAIRRRALGPDHPATASSLNHVALLLREQGEPAAARPLLEHALAVRERMLGPDHPDTADSLINLGAVFWDQGELDAARPLFERALAIREQVLGSDHPHTAQGLHNLGIVLHSQCDLAAARSCCERALSIRERVLGPDHPDTAYSLDRMALLLQAQGDLDAAKPLLERALRVREWVLGPDHHRTAESVHNLGVLLVAQGDPAAARPLFERALAIRESVLVPGHPYTVATRHALKELGAQPGCVTGASAGS